MEKPKNILIREQYGSAYTLLGNKLVYMPLNPDGKILYDEKGFVDFYSLDEELVYKLKRIRNKLLKQAKTI